MAKAIPEETRQGVAADYLAGMSPKEIKDKYNIGESTVYNIVSSMKMSELTEKEPAPAVTETDSEKRKNTIMNSIDTNNTTSSSESQALRGVEMIGVMQSMLLAAEGDFGAEVDIMALKADSDTASIMFRYGGKAYSLQFGLAF